MREDGLNFIDGAWVAGGSGWAEVTDPASGEVLARQAMADAADVDRAVQAARRVHESGVLSALRPVERGRMVQAMGRHLLAHQAEIARTLTLEQGKPLWQAMREIAGAARYFEYYGNQAETLEGRAIPLGAGYEDFTRLEPYGVSAQIIPWNFPVEIAARSIAAGLATGNACVVKTSELTPLSSAWLARAAQAAGLPEGALNILSGWGPEAGAALAAHPGIDQMVFTGSVATGIAIAQAAAANVVPCVLELGGKSAAIVHADADLDAFEAEILKGIFLNAGQVCSAMSRVLVHRDRHDELVARAVAVARSLSVGPGIGYPEPGPSMGPLVSAAQRERAVAMVARAVREGARVATGGRALNIPGAFLEPTVLVDVAPRMEIAQEEVFAPVQCIIPFADEAEAIAIANGTRYGLVAGVFTRDLERAMRACRALRAGQVFVNEWFAGGVETPFGGYGRSGYGREKGREALRNYVQTKNVAIAIRGGCARDQARAGG
ncbi:MAG: aldehyde dehydrogenase family protein [Roseovarius sp.]